MTTVLLGGGEDLWPTALAKSFPLKVNLVALQRKGAMVSDLVEAIVREAVSDRSKLPVDVCVAFVLQRCGLDDTPGARKTESVERFPEASPSPLLGQPWAADVDDGASTTVVLRPETARAVPLADYLRSDTFDCRCIVLTSWRSVCKSEGWDGTAESATHAQRAAGGDRLARTKPSVAGGTPRRSSTTSGADFSPTTGRKRTRSPPPPNEDASAALAGSNTRRAVLPASPDKSGVAMPRPTERRVATTYELEQLNAWVATGVIASEHCPASLRCPVCDAVYTSPVVVGCCCATQCAACAERTDRDGATDGNDVVKCGTCGEERRRDDVTDNRQVAAAIEQWRHEVSVMYQKEPPLRPLRPHLRHPSEASAGWNTNAATELFPRTRRPVPGADRGGSLLPHPLMSAQPPVLAAPFPLPSAPAAGAHWQPAVSIGGRRVPPAAQYPRPRR